MTPLTAEERATLDSLAARNGAHETLRVVIRSSGGQELSCGVLAAGAGQVRVSLARSFIEPWNGSP